jgi:DNA-binding transcriptional MerR regulator
MKDLQIKKLYYSISEVSRMVGLEQYVLRYWETEFEQLRPQKNRAGNRVYTDKDIEIIKLIKKLTREDRYTIEGARQVLGSVNLENGVAELLEGVSEPGAEEAPPDLREDLKAIRSTLVDLLNVLDPDADLS